jgi:hypothetical protein
MANIQNPKFQVHVRRSCVLPEAWQFGIFEGETQLTEWQGTYPSYGKAIEFGYRHLKIIHREPKSPTALGKALVRSGSVVSSAEAK